MVEGFGLVLEKQGHQIVDDDATEDAIMGFIRCKVKETIKSQ